MGEEGAERLSAETRARCAKGMGRLDEAGCLAVVLKLRSTRELADEYGLSVHSIREYRRRLNGLRSDRSPEYNNRRRWKTVGVEIGERRVPKQKLERSSSNQFDLEDTEEL